LPGTTGTLTVNCAGTGGNARNGTGTQPVTIRAQNERRAFLSGTGSTPIEIANCSNWRIEGLYARNADNVLTGAGNGEVVRVQNCSALTLRRLLAVHPNMHCANSVIEGCNSQGILVSQSRNVLVEESEVYDYHRHAFSTYLSVGTEFRRTYSNDRGAAGDTSAVAYSSSRCLIENHIGEGPGRISVNASGTTIDGTLGGRDNRVLGSVVLDVSNNQGAVVQARPFAPPGDARAAKRNLFRNVVFAHSGGHGLYSRGSYDTVLENVTMLENAQGDGAAAFAADDEEGILRCSEITEGCSFRMTNNLLLRSGRMGIWVEPESLGTSWLVEYTNVYGSRGWNYPTSEAIADQSGNIRSSQSVAPTGVGLGQGQCLMWIPDGSNMKRAGKNGADIGATILYRYEGGQLTMTPLWNPTTGEFSCGAVVPGVNDVAGASCRDVHKRLNVNTNGCPFPASYP
jgi:hypothetical protein